MKLSDISLCTHPEADECEYYLYLLYKQQNAIITLPHGEPFPCEHCKWLVRDVSFFLKKEY